MKRVSRFETLDGVIHETKAKADKHLEMLYSNALIHIGKRMMVAYESKNYNTGLLEYIDTNLSEFVELKRIKDDMQLLNPEEDD